MIDPTLTARLLLAAVLATAVIGKTRDRARWAEFVESVRGTLPLPPSWTPALAAATVAAEALTALLLLPAATAPLGLAAATALMCALTAVVVIGIRAPVPTACVCFGSTSTPMGARHLIRNLLLTAAAGTGTALVLLGTATAPAPATTALSALTAAVLAALVIRLDDLVDLFGAPAPTSPSSH